MKNIYDVIKKPSLTEKAMAMQDVNKVVLKVDARANKIEIKEAVELLFKVNVKCVNTVNVFGKQKRVGKNVGRTSAWKKAIVTLAMGDKLDFLENI